MAEARRVVITGLGVRAAGVRSPADLAARLRAGVVAIRPVAADNWPGFPAGRLGAPLDGFDTETEVAAFGPTATRAVRHSSRAVAAATVAALAALAEARLGPAARARCGVVLAGSNIAMGTTWAAGERFRREPAYTSVRHGYTYFDTHLTSVVAEAAGLGGPGLSVGGASASGNSAVAIAADLIALGRVDAVLVVGPLADLSPVEWRALDQMGALAAEGASACRPFDRAANGFAPAEACASVLLEALGPARARGATPLAELAGSAIVQSPRQGAAPDSDAAWRAMATALDQAGIAPAALGAISAHATGTPAGDAAECDAIARLLGRAVGAVPVNAPKSLLGHALQAAGVLELVALVVQMQGGFLHGNAGLAEPISDTLNVPGPGTIECAVEWALSNGFGFGGINTSLLLRNGRALAG